LWVLYSVRCLLFSDTRLQLLDAWQAGSRFKFKGIRNSAIQGSVLKQTYPASTVGP
jgi:hypothetical protein